MNAWGLTPSSWAAEAARCFSSSGSLSEVVAIVSSQVAGATKVTPLRAEFKRQAKELETMSQR
jgi:hypothetical protein